MKTTRKSILFIVILLVGLALSGCFCPYYLGDWHGRGYWYDRGDYRDGGYDRQSGDYRYNRDHR